MNNKLTPKEESILCHKVATLMSLLADYTAELYPNTTIPEDFRTKAEEMMPLANELLGSLYEIPAIKSTTYLNDLSNKIDTVLRKNYVNIK